MNNITLFLLIGTIIILAVALVVKSRKYTSACKEISHGWRNIVINEDIRMKDICESGIDRYSIANVFGYRIVYLIKAKASFNTVFNLIKETGCNKELESLNDEDPMTIQVACKIQAIVRSHVTADEIQEWLNVAIITKSLTKKQKEEFENSFLSKIKPSGFVVNLKVA